MNCLVCGREIHTACFKMTPFDCEMCRKYGTGEIGVEKWRSVMPDDVKMLPKLKGGKLPKIRGKKIKMVGGKVSLVG